MKNALNPATRLMAQLRLLPKFLLVSLLFVLPLGLVSGLLFNELQKSIAATELEQEGLRKVTEAEEIHVLLQQHQALRFMERSGNEKVQAQVKQLQTGITGKLQAFGADDSLGRIGVDDSMAGLQKQWNALAQQKDTKARDDYLAHSALIAQVQKLRAHIANRSKLRLDPEANTHFLALTLLDDLPALTESILTLSGRGASYIDTGLLEANEELLLSSTVNGGKNRLSRLSEQFSTLFDETPAWKIALDKPITTLPVVAGFFDRATNEVLKSVDQSSGDQFFAAGQQASQQLQAISAAAGEVLEQQLTERAAQARWRRNEIMMVVLAVLGLAGYLLAGFYASFREEIGFLRNAVESTASGDLRLQAVSHGKDEISLLVGAFSDMNQRLSQLISNVRRSAKVIRAASHEIAVGNGNLSQRTESQASSLQETAASMDQLTATVRKNASNAEQANQLALSAADFAVKGGQAVGAVVATMTSIKGSSDKIGGIIGVIDAIAFQTNILALNAAVEAARAGEQGRGFAVVASEVRMLAQRSAAAAKEIKDLIDDSVRKVEVGSKQVEGAGQTMQDIVISIKEVVDIMRNITSASQQQSTGIAEVGAEMANIDTMTQRNAALVEEATAAAESLQQHASLLAEAVSVFKLDDADAQAVSRTETVPLPIPATNIAQSVPLALQRQRNAQTGLLETPRKRAA